MNIELSKEEMRLLLNWFFYKAVECGITPDDEDYTADQKLRKKLEKALDNIIKA